MRRIWAVIKLILLFTKELFLSSYAVLKHIVKPKVSYKPNIFAYETELRTDLELTLLSSLICLTPGTLTLDVSKDRRTLMIHAMDAPDVEEAAAQIRGTFEKAIMGVTR